MTGVRTGVGEGEAVGAGVPVGAGVGVALGDGTGVGVAEGVGTGVGVAVGLGVGLGAGVGVGDAVDPTEVSVNPVGAAFTLPGLPINPKEALPPGGSELCQEKALALKLKVVPVWLTTVALQMLVIWPGIESDRLQLVRVWEEVFWMVTFP